MTRLHDPDVADPPIGEFSASELGAMLRETRVTQGRELEDIAEELRIRLVYLQAIEEGHLEELPGITYATGFLRAYGDFLGLDGEDLVRRFKAAGIATAQTTDLHLPSPVEEGRLPTGSVLLVAALLAVGAYGGWYYMSSQGRDPIDVVAALPDPLAELVGTEGQNGETAVQADTGSNAAVTESSGTNAAGMIAPNTYSPVDTASDSMTPSAEDEPESMATADTAGSDSQTSSPVVSAASADDAVPTSAGPTGSAAETATDQVAPASVAMQPVPDSEPSNTEPMPATPAPAAVQAVAPEPPAAPRPKPIVVERIPAPSAPTIAAPETEDTATDAPAATTIVAAATSGESSTDPISTQSVTVVPVLPKVHRVVLRANIDTWVEVAAAEGVPVLSRLLREGETFEVPSRPGLMMTTGNAGGIDILIDGKAIPQLGSVGEVRTNIVLDAESLLARRVATP